MRTDGEGKTVDGNDVAVLFAEIERQRGWVGHRGR